jgi:DNA-binding HxlR family transcriptional regulator
VEKKEALFCARDAAMQDETVTRGRLAKLAAAMGPDGVDRDDPTRSVMAMLGDRWSPLILLVLETGEWRHADLRRVTAQLSSEKALSQRVLTLKLRALEAHGFVSRQVTTDVPPKVSYALTPLGQELVAQLQRMINWLDAHRAVIHAARGAFTG